MNFLRKLFCRPVVLNVEHFGGRMTWEQLQTAFLHRQDDPLFRAMGQVLECQRQMSQRAVQDKANLPGGLTAFEAGAAASASDSMGLMLELAAGKCRDAEMRAWFGPESKPKSE